MKHKIFIIFLGVSAALVGTFYVVKSQTDRNIPIVAHNKADLTIDLAGKQSVVAHTSDSSELTTKVNANKKLGEIIAMLENFQESVKELQTAVVSLNERVENIETGQMNPRLNLADKLKQFEQRRAEDEATAVARQMEQQQIQKAYIQSLENKIINEFDESLSQEIGSTYENFLAVGGSWTEGVSLNVVECGGDYCKLSFTFQKNMDPLAQFELDGRILVEAQKMGKLGQSMTVERSKSDGTIETTTFFAKQGKNLPSPGL